MPWPPGNQPPSVTLTAPSANASYSAPASIALAASAADLEGAVARVDFYANGMLVASDPTSPYAATWTNVAEGSYSLTAVAVDADGVSTSTASTPIVVWPAGTSETVLLADDFNDDALDTVKWDTTDLFSGTEDPAIPVAETGGQIRIGPLLANASGSHYHGIDSQDAYDVTDAAASVELVQPASSGAVAYAMFTVGANNQNYYRLFVTGSTLVAQRNLGNVKHDVTLAYDAAAHRFLRIRHHAATGEALWETAPSVGGQPGT